MATHFTSSAAGEDDLDDILIDRYWLGETTPEERAVVEVWFLAHPGRRSWYEQLRQGINADSWVDWSPAEVRQTVSKVLGVPREHDVRGNARSSLDLPTTAAASGRPLARDMSGGVAGGHRTIRRWWATPGTTIFGVAAVAFSLFVVGIATSLLFGWPDIGTPNTSAVSTHTTGNGQRTTITLPDGSTVLLNVASRLEVPADYDRGNRTLRLEGEALFTVVHHGGRPFTVIAGPSTTRVLGTSFVVRHYTTDSAATVAVRDGKVMVGSQVLTMAQQVLVGIHGTGSVHPASPTQFGFASGVLMFNGISLPDAIPQLNRWYDADIRLEDPALATQQIVARFKAGSLTDLAAILEMMYNVQVVREGRVLTLYSGKP